MLCGESLDYCKHQKMPVSKQIHARDAGLDAASSKPFARRLFCFGEATMWQRRLNAVWFTFAAGQLIQFKQHLASLERDMFRRMSIRENWPEDIEEVEERNVIPLSRPKASF